MSTQGIKVLVVGHKFDLPYEVKHLPTPANVLATIASFKPDTIVTTLGALGVLSTASFSVHKRWIQVSPETPIEKLIALIEENYAHNIYSYNVGDITWPLVSIYTPTYNTGHFLQVAWDSLKTQTYATFEWVVVDDCSTDGTWDELVRLAKTDPRVKPYQTATHSGKIGALKDAATRLCRGEFFVELDHDDQLVETALAKIVKAFRDNPEVGFVYSDYAAFFENGEPHRFPAEYQYPWNTPDRYYEVEYHGRKMLVCRQVDIYDSFGVEHFTQQFGWYLTVGPNHVRCFRATTFQQFGGYNQHLYVADDWDLMARFFLRSKCLCIHEMLYLYCMRDAWGNATFERNQSIQDHLAIARNNYAREFMAYFDSRKKEGTLRGPIMAPLVPMPKSLKPNDEPAFVIASRTPEDAAALRGTLKDQDVFVASGEHSIFAAYEKGRQHFHDRRRIVYLHDDIEIHDVPTFIEIIKSAGSGLHGVIGSAAPDALENGNPWWDLPTIVGGVEQSRDGERIKMNQGNTDVACDATWLDGLCLIAVDQEWSWRLPGDPSLWHAYDWLACKRTKEAGFPVRTIAQPAGPLLLHYGWGREEDLLTTVAAVKALSRDPATRRDYYNVRDHFPRLIKEAHGTVLELGSREGSSAGALLEGVCLNGGDVWSVDIEKSCETAWQGHPRWHFIHCDSRDVEGLRKAGLPEVIDVLFLDTDEITDAGEHHTYNRVKEELALWWDRMAPDGTIISHDTESYPGVALALVEVAATKGLQVELVKGCNGIGIIKLQSNVSRMSFVVLDATGGDMAVNCLKSINQFAPGAEIVLVGNGVHSQLVAQTAAHKYVHIEGNIGFAAGCNRGAKAATRDIVCFLNDDANFIDETTPKELAKAVLERDCIAGPYSNRAKSPQGNVAQATSVGTVHHVPTLAGLCMAMKRDLFERLHGFDARFLTGEDDDICRRAAALGVTCAVIGGAWVNHLEHSTFKAMGLNPQDVIKDNKVRLAGKYPSVRVIAIAKDEGAALPGFFEQFKGITNDFCILDTGSTDNTVEVASAHGARVVTIPDLVINEGFAAARNKAVNLFREGCDWIIMLDPDERLDRNTLDGLPELLFQAQHDIYLAPLWAVSPNGDRREYVGKVFMYRNKPEIEWCFKVHEKVIGSPRQAMIVNGCIEHVLALHEGPRRSKAEGLYQKLASTEPYFADPAYKATICEMWPILDYDRPREPRVAEIHVGPLVSVVIPTYKRPEQLAAALGSAFKQTWQNLEVIVVGDHDPQLAPQTHARLRVLNLPENHGAGGAVPRNVAIQAAQGSYIAYLDDDNTWTPDHVASVMAAIRSSGKTWGFSSMAIAGETPDAPMVDLKFDTPKFQGIDTSCVIHPVGFFDKYGPWKDRTEANYHHDWEFISRFVTAGEPWVATKQPTLHYGLTSCGQAEFLRELAKKKG